MAFFVMSFVQNSIALTLVCLGGYFSVYFQHSLMALFQMIVPNEVRGKFSGCFRQLPYHPTDFYGIMGLIKRCGYPSAILLFCAFA
jgi:hypothetical protein